MSLGRNKFSLCFIIPISEFSIKINNALMRKEMAWWFHCGNGRKNPGLWSHQNTWPTLRTKIGTSLPCARISSEAKQIKKIDFYHSRVRNSICLMLWDLDKCCFLKKNPTVFTYLLRLLCIGHKDAKRLWTVWRHCASLVQVAPLCGKEAVSSGRLYHHSSLEEEKPGVSGRTPAGRLLRWIHRMVLEG